MRGAAAVSRMTRRWTGRRRSESVEEVRRAVRAAEAARRTFIRREAELVVDSDFACELLAAAECVALMMGRRSRDFPDDLAERLAGAGEPDSLLFHQARNAVLHVLRNSELAELWEEAAAECRRQRMARGDDAADRPAQSAISSMSLGRPKRSRRTLGATGRPAAASSAEAGR